MLIVGLTLPVLLMIGFMVASALPASGDPPKYSLVFSINDYRNNQSMPVSVNLVVKNGVLMAQYSKQKDGNNNYGAYWRKLYLFDAKTQRVRELEFGLPKTVDQITGTLEEPVEATKEIKLSTELKSPDGYELSDSYYHHGGLFNEVFFGWGRNSSGTTITNGSRNVKLSPDDGRTYFYNGQAQFIGWVTP
ncbi:hypothetical protein ABHF33_13455 [Chitinibacter sp. FCG-7]|uniref:Uncharacterized protein n=1 Tax=Chitinibacter mangrovi TaxID=3153927 RepID=A0AAU7F8Q8_9NEIS